MDFYERKEKATKLINQLHEKGEPLDTIIKSVVLTYGFSARWVVKTYNFLFVEGVVSEKVEEVLK